MGVRGPTPSCARGIITITIAIVPSCKFFLVLPLRGEALRLRGGGWRSVAAAGTTLTGFFSATSAPTRRGILAAFVASASFTVLAADCEHPHQGNAQGIGAAGSRTRAISDLGALLCVAGSSTGASFHRVTIVVTRASTTFSRGWQPLVVMLALRYGYYEDPAHLVSSTPRKRRLRLAAPPSSAANLWTCSGLSVIPKEEGMSKE